MSIKLKPFDLEAALRGEPVVTRDGRPVTQVTKFDANNKRYCIAAVVDGDVSNFTLDGNYYLYAGSDFDLFMVAKTVKKEGWVNLYKTDDETLAAKTSHAHKTRESAELAALESCIATIRVEWEEEI